MPAQAGIQIGDFHGFEATPLPSPGLPGMMDEFCNDTPRSLHYRQAEIPIESYRCRLPGIRLSAIQWRDVFFTDKPNLTARGATHFEPVAAMFQDAQLRRFLHFAHAVGGIARVVAHRQWAVRNHHDDSFRLSFRFSRWRARLRRRWAWRQSAVVPAPRQRIFAPSAWE